MIGAIILAAGESTRMGEPKALLKLGPQTFLDTIIETASGAGLVPIVVVLGAQADKILSRHDLHGIITVWNEDMVAGPIGSIRTGIRVLFNRPVEAVIVWHVDRPHVKISTIEALVGSYHEGSAQIVLPQFGGRRGHPVLFGREVFQELLEAPAPTGARQVVRAVPGRVATVAVSDPAILEDINTPGEYRSLLRRLNLGGC